MPEIEKNAVLDALSHHIGKKNGVSAKDLVSEVTWKSSTPAQCRALRHVIEMLRLEGHHICAHPSYGYYIAENDIELNESCEFLLHRAMTSLEQISKMKKASIPDLRGQLGLKI